MLKRHKNALAGVTMAALLGAGIGTALGREQTPRAQDKVALGGPRVKHLLLLMDQDQNGKISKKEFMQFMQAEFDRLDKDQSGELDVKELTHSKGQSTSFTVAGK
jgi:hypothetical protein